jgi:hypothetical protein
MQMAAAQTSRIRKDVCAWRDAFMELSTAMQVTRWRFESAPEQGAHVLHARIGYIDVGYERRARRVLQMRTDGYYIASTRTQVGKDVLNNN